ncbi:bifunctional homocysteine S-methyltransferase/methylenetetrahydrofolate reductase [Alkalicoccus urumqiensis]|uniref:Bifunctional homocysteine S-methyltransferase/methylenetetrahydrofolate reductase n=1 Tax=Alkalicoccus urumqiensis TaxID=1548213 RepID=A0A2P6MI80_ALKUR|nr:bifunctional homocysteine S-methyltransferase/methylenetetrahydrofolate reductase [Alkalicoccus urumqiensis]PRO65968.1 bifunctional homocysteine S-methyltransferase/methylenetetrahydrofolate reductase [Alkalicoccus urumqiensis]
MNLKEKLRQGLTVGDGAMGTLLYQRGLRGCFEELNLSDPDQIQSIHEKYIAAGADIIQTNTYAANAIKLDRYQLGDCVKEINEAGAAVARRAGSAYTAATIGGVATMHQEKTPLEDRMDALKEQADVLLQTDVDGFILETFYDFDELKQILSYLREHTDRAIIAQATLGDIGVLHTGMPIEAALKELEALGADVAGVNCRMGPYHMLQSLEETDLLSTAGISVYPNASLPNVRDGRFSYQSNPTYFGDMTQALVEEGAVLIGGCCGTTPEHIQEIRQAIIRGRLTPPQEKQVRRNRTAVKEEVSGDREPVKLTETSREQTSVIVELDPPKALSGVPAFMEGARALTEAGATAVTLADNSLASSRIDNLALGTKIKDAGSRPLLHVACRDRNIIGLQSHLLGLHELGVRDILAITGDPAKVGDFPGATSVYDMSSMDLVRLIKQLNEGQSFSGKDLGAKTNFTVGAAFNANARRLDREVQRLEKKVQAGADYFMSQPVYSSERIEEIADAVKDLPVPVYIGIMPLVSSRNAEFLHHEVPGIQLTDSVREQMRALSGDREASEAEGIRMAKELVDTAMKHFDHIYLITPFLRYNITAELTQHIRTQEAAVNAAR